MNDEKQKALRRIDAATEQRKERRQMFVDRLQADSRVKAPGVWIDAAADFLTVGNNGAFYEQVKSVLSDIRMLEPRSFWQDADEAYETHNRDRRERDAQHGPAGYSFGFDGFRRDIVMQLAFRGGPLPMETVGEIRERRLGLARQARRLAEALSAEPQLRHVSPDYAALVRSLADTLEGESIGKLDPVNRADWMPQPGRETAQQALLERNLCREFKTCTGSPQYKLVATALDVALDLPEATDPEKLRSRWRDYLKTVGR